MTVNRRSASANDTITVSATVRNTGTRAGSQVVQLYAATPFEPKSAQRPVKRLESFQKVQLRPGQSKRVSFRVKASALAFFNETANKYVVDPGRYVFQVATSAAKNGVQGQASTVVHGHDRPDADGRQRQADRDR